MSKALLMDLHNRIVKERLRRMVQAKRQPLKKELREDVVFLGKMDRYIANYLKEK